MVGSDDQPLTPLLHFLIPWCTSTARPGPHVLLYVVRTLLLLLPWGYFFSRESFTFAVKLFFLPWGFFLFPWVFFFLPWSFFFRSESFLFAVRFFFRPRVFFLFREVISFAVTVPTVCTHSSFAHTWNKDDRFTKTSWCSEILGLALIENLFFILIFISHSLIVRWSWFFM